MQSPERTNPEARRWTAVKPTLHLMVGLPCSGKTTLARRLEHEREAIRFTPDEWHVRLFGRDATDDRHNPRHDEIERIMWGLAERLLAAGVSVILDFGFWSREEREDFRARAHRVGAASELHFLDVADEELLYRARARNGNLPDGAFDIPPGLMEHLIPMLQRPGADELIRRE